MIDETQLVCRREKGNGKVNGWLCFVLDSEQQQRQASRFCLQIELICLGEKGREREPIRFSAAANKPQTRWRLLFPLPFLLVPSFSVFIPPPMCVCVCVCLGNPFACQFTRFLVGVFTVIHFLFFSRFSFLLDFVQLIETMRRRQLQLQLQIERRRIFLATSSSSSLGWILFSVNNFWRLNTLSTTPLVADSTDG